MRKSKNVLAICTSLMGFALVGDFTIKAAEDKNVSLAASIDWGTSYQGAVDDAVQSGKSMLVRITATWCGPCQQMKQLTFNDSRVVKLTNSSFVPLLIDADQHPDLVAGFHIESYPTTLVVAPDLSILKKLKGFQSADSLLTHLTPLAQEQAADHAASSSEETASALDPENAIRFGFDGYCLVSLLEETKVRKGNAEFSTEYRGQTVCFHTDENRQLFLSDPERYWPVANGECLVSSREGANSGQGDPRMAVTWRGKIWLFSDRECQKRFIESPFYYANEL
jgi:YHS domain-containing protein